MSRQDQNNVTVTVELRDGTVLSLGTFDKRSGGDGGAEDSKYRPGNMADEISLGGPQTTENVTVSRLYDEDRDGEFIARLLPERGKAKMVTQRQSLDDDENAIGTPTVWRGRLLRVGFPEDDSESADASLFELEQSAASVTKQ